jgi:hypothetical protein
MRDRQPRIAWAVGGGNISPPQQLDVAKRFHRDVLVVVPEYPREAEDIDKPPDKTPPARKNENKQKSPIADVGVMYSKEQEQVADACGLGFAAIFFEEHVLFLRCAVRKFASDNSGKRVYDGGWNEG